MDSLRADVDSAHRLHNWIAWRCDLLEEHPGLQAMVDIARMELKYNQGHEKYHSSGTNRSMLTEAKQSFTNYTLAGVAECITSDVWTFFGVSNTKKATCPCRERYVFFNCVVSGFFELNLGHST